MTVATPPPPAVEQTELGRRGPADAVVLMRFDSRRRARCGVDTLGPSILQASAVGRVQLVK